MMKALQRTTVQQSGHDIITSTSKGSSKVQAFVPPPKEPLAIATPELARLEQLHAPMSSVQELSSLPVLESEGPRGPRPAHSGSQPAMLIAQQAATIQPGVQIGSLLASTKRSREENGQVVQNFVGRSLYHKSSQSRERQGSQEAIVNRKLRKDSRSTTK